MIPDFGCHWRSLWAASVWAGERTQLGNEAVSLAAEGINGGTFLVYGLSALTHGVTHNGGGEVHSPRTNCPAPAWMRSWSGRSQTLS